MNTLYTPDSHPARYTQDRFALDTARTAEPSAGSVLESGTRWTVWLYASDFDYDWREDHNVYAHDSQEYIAPEPVMFRIDSDGWLFALFVAQPADLYDAKKFLCYVNEGGHCSADFDNIKLSRPATWDECAAMYHTLTHYPYTYNLDVCQRHTVAHRAEFMRRLRAAKG